MEMVSGETLDNRDSIQTFDSVVPFDCFTMYIEFYPGFGITWNSNNAKYLP